MERNGRTLSRKSLDFIRLMMCAVLAGAVTGVAEAIFGRVLNLITSFRVEHWQVLIPFLPLAGLLIIWLYRKFSPESQRGMALIFETGHRQRDNIPLILVPLCMVATWLTHLFGGSAGREGVAVQIGATLSYRIGRKLKDPDKERMMLIAGMAAGFAGIFQTPVAAVLFAMEVMTSGVIEYEALLPSLTAAFTSCFVSGKLGLSKESITLVDTINIGEPENVLKLIALGIVFGLVGRLFAVLLSRAKRVTKKMTNPFKRIVFLSIPLTVLLFASQGRYSGLGSELVRNGLAGSQIYPFDWILKLLLTVFSLAIGFQGGEVTPLFSIGACLGCWMGSLFGLPPAVTAALGYAAVFGSATNTFFAPVLIGMEVFGTDTMFLFLIVCTTAYLVRGCSIYSGQWNMKTFAEKE